MFKIIQSSLKFCAKEIYKNPNNDIVKHWLSEKLGTKVFLVNWSSIENLKRCNFDILNYKKVQQH